MSGVQRAGAFATEYAWGLPPAEVLDGAACSPASASWFDSVTDEEVQKHGRRETWTMRAKAMAFCRNICPVQSLCLSDNRVARVPPRGRKARRQPGVHGGVYVTEDGRELTVDDALNMAKSRRRLLVTGDKSR
jgi:hypothetical protein